jgi:cell wall-associated NlpC family hydrolase
MPEREVKAKGPPMTGLARALLTLTVSLALTACMPNAARDSARPSGQLPPPPAAVVKVPEPLTPMTPEQTGAVRPLAVALQSYRPSLPPQSFIFTNGLIDQDRLLAGPFPGRLATAQAGERLLLAYGLTPFREGEPDQIESEQLPALEAAPSVIAASALIAPAFDLAATDPAPSAGLTGGRQAEDRAVSGQAGPAGGRTQNLLTLAYEQTGRHYKIGGFSPVSGFDAPGYTCWVFAREGLNLPKTPAALAAAGTAVAKEDLRPGDVLIYRNPTDQVNGWHVGIYSGQGNFLHASPKAGVVTETDAFGPQYAPYFLTGRRFFNDPEAAPLSDEQKTAATSTAVKLALAELGPNDKIVRPAPAKPRPKPKSAPAKAAQKAAKTKGPKATKKGKKTAAPITGSRIPAAEA